MRNEEYGNHTVWSSVIEVDVEAYFQKPWCVLNHDWTIHFQNRQHGLKFCVKYDYILCSRIYKCKFK